MNKQLLHISKLTTARVLADHPELRDLTARKNAAFVAMRNADGIPEFTRLHRVAKPLCIEWDGRVKAHYSVIV
jgi:hypothetical protein